jgi:hypothetical protein
MSSADTYTNLDKLAQLDPGLIIKQLDTAKTLIKRARSKWYTQQFVAPLLELQSPLHGYYQSAMDCAKFISIENGKPKSSYCNTRVCNTCNRIRTAIGMNGYMEQLKGREWVMITLTDVNCQGHELRHEIDGLKRTLRLIRRKLKKRGTILDGIVKAEITYNEKTKTFHPHLHVLAACQNIEFVAVELINEWLERRPTASLKAQNITRDPKGAFNELFKYTTKGYQREGKTLTIDALAIDTIMRAQYKTRSFQPFGNIRKVTEEVQEIIQAQPIEKPDGIYMWYDHDWYSLYTGEALSYYLPDPDIKITHARIRHPADN